MTPARDEGARTDTVVTVTKPIDNGIDQEASA